MINLTVSANERIEISAYNSNSATTLNVTIVQKNPLGEITYTRELITPNTNRSISVHTFRLIAGVLITVDVRSNGTLLKRGECFVVINLLHGSIVNNDQAICLAADYVTHPTSVNAPTSGINAPEDGRGFIREFPGTTPAVGAEVSETVPTNAIWRLITLHVGLLTSSQVANRVAAIQITDGTTVKLTISSGVTQTASTTLVYNYVEALGTQDVSIRPAASFPTRLRMPSGFTIDTLTTDIQTSDRWLLPQFIVEEWLTS